MVQSGLEKLQTKRGYMPEQKRGYIPKQNSVKYTAVRSNLGQRSLHVLLQQIRKEPYTQ
jgi:hypothetical protein